MPQSKIFIVTGPVRTGKTTRLRDWVSQNNNVKGILTPVVEDRRMFYEIYTGEYFQMEASANETDILSIGRFIFSRKSFLKAESIIDEAIENCDWLVIDEIGPLELKGEGFASILKKIITETNRNFNLVLVIRNSILPDVKEIFGLNEFDLLEI